MITPLFEQMNLTGTIHPMIERRKLLNSKLERITQGCNTYQQMQRAEYPPRAPPAPTQGQDQVSFEIPIYHMHVKRVYVDNEGVLVYQNQGGVVYKMLNFHDYDYPPVSLCTCMKERKLK